MAAEAHRGLADTSLYSLGFEKASEKYETYLRGSQRMPSVRTWPRRITTSGISSRRQEVFRLLSRDASR